MDADPRTEAALLAATARDPSAFAVFYLRHEERVLAWLLRRTGRADLSADLCAEVFAAALSSAHRFRDNGPPADAWLFGIARNVLGASLRRGRVEARARVRLGMAPIELTDEMLQSIDDLRDDGSAAAALADLPEDQRQAIHARIVEERDYADIARELRCSEQVVRKRVSRGLAVLRARVEEQP
jgi:RNA polymerase sigma factor (sigma-70 family)